MSRLRGKSSETVLCRLNQSFRSPNYRTTKDSLKSKISQVSYKQYEHKLRTLKLIRGEKNSSLASASRVKPDSFLKDSKKINLSTSINTDTTCLDLSSIECQDFIKSSDSYRKLKLDLKPADSEALVSLGMSLQSPLSKIPETDQDLEKTPAFKVKSSVLRTRKNGSSCKKKRKELGKANKENGKRSSFGVNKNEQTEQTILEILANQEKVFNKKIGELGWENDRKIRMLEERIVGLKKENEKLIGLVEEKQGESEGRDRRAGASDRGLDYERLLSAYEQVKCKNLALEKIVKGNLCTKCKAFVSTNSRLEDKIERIRDYINNH